MCGIAGYSTASERQVARDAVSKMLDLLKKRGPNDVGITDWSQMVLGHRRLSVFDLTSAGHQPMLSADRRVGVAFNGAIYNFQSLRKDLESKGHHFRSQTDTEVLINGYKEWGIDSLLSRIDGMFAFGLWDDREQRLFLVRDRLGVKPLAYWTDGEEFAFASTIRALKSALGGELDPVGVAEFLEFGFVTDENSIYAGFHKVLPGELIEWHDGRISKRIYWDLPKPSSESIVSFEDAVEETQRRFVDAVEKRLQADVPVGALLSGGIDSSLVCWAISKLGADVAAYTVSTPADAEDEAHDAAKTAKALGLQHHVLELSANRPPKVLDLSKAFAEPFACASALGMLEISREARNSVTVLLTGDGGDDVFLGYPEHRHFQLSGNIAKQLPKASTSLWRAARHAIPAVGTLKRAISLIDYSVGGLGAVGNARDGLPFYEHNNILGERLKRKTLSHRHMNWSVESGRNLLSEFLAYDRNTRFTGEYLTKVDGATMHYALEARSPFLDTKLWEFASKLPFSVRLKGGASKAILREIARRHLGKELARGKKKGFTIPVQRWIAGKWKANVESVLKDSILAKDDWINADAALQVLDRTSRTGWVPRQLWFLYVLESWLRYENGFDSE